MTLALAQRVEALEIQVKDLAQEIQLRGYLYETQFAAVFADLGLIKRRLDAFSGMVDAAPCQITQVVME